MLTYSEARILAVEQEMADTAKFNLLGKGLNKQCYHMLGQNWVVLCISKGKEAEAVDEIQTLLRLKQAGVLIPDMGDVSTNEALFNVKIKGVSCSAFLEEYIQGFEIDRQGATASSDTQVKAFGDRVSRYLSEELTDFNVARQMYKVTIDSLNRLRSAFTNIQGFDIPDFQIRFDQSTGAILTVDPGYSQKYGFEGAKHLGWIKAWENYLNTTDLTRFWNKKHPASPIKKEDWA